MGEKIPGVPGESTHSSSETPGSDRAIEQLRHLVESAEPPAHEPALDDDRIELMRTPTNVGRRRTAALAAGAAVAVVALVVGVHVIDRRGSTPAASAISPATNSVPAQPQADPIPAPKIAAVALPRRASATSSAIRVDPSSGAANFGVTHYEVWRRDASEKNAPWQVVGNIPVGLVPARGHIYTDPNEIPGHTYGFRVVAVSPTSRSQYNEIQVTPQR